MITVIKGTYGKTRKYMEVDTIPQIGDVWRIDGYTDEEMPKIIDIVDMNDTVAETTSGCPTYENDFYKITYRIDGEDFDEYIYIENPTKLCSDFDNLSSQEKKAIMKVIDYVDLIHGMDEEEAKDVVLREYDNDYVTLNKGRDGKQYAWYFYEDRNVVVEVESLKIIEDEDFINDNFC